MQIEIARITNLVRLRKDLGDIKSLAESIQEVGLIHPIVLDEDNKLIAGRRRIAAAVRLGWTKIPCTILSLDDTMIGEIHENTQRKDFTPSEIADISDYITKNRIGHRPKKGSESDTFLKGNTNPLVAKITGVSHDTVAKIKKIKEAADKNPLKYGRLMQKMDSGHTSVNTAYQIITQEERSLPKAKLPKGKYDVILCDIPEKFNRGSTARGSSDQHYDTMSPQEIAGGIFDKHNIRELFAVDAVIFFWISTAFQYHLIEATQLVRIPGQGTYEIKIEKPTYHAILESWDFDPPMTEFVWKKDRIGLGSYSRSQHEKCLLAYRGKMPRPAKLFSTILEYPRGAHSAKPPIYSMIMEMYPKRRYCELFGRKNEDRPKSWAVFGNEVE